MIERQWGDLLNWLKTTGLQPEEIELAVVRYQKRGAALEQRREEEAFRQSQMELPLGGTEKSRS